MKAKKRKPPDARDARVETMPAVGCSCIFEEVLPIVAASLQRSGEAKKRAGVQQKKNRGIGQKQKFETSKAGCSKRIA